MIIGDFNQVEKYEDKLGGSSTIRGCNAFINWRFKSNMVEVPFQGPRFSWTNKQIGTTLLMERLDIVHHEPILCSDHAAIVYTNMITTMLLNDLIR